MFPLFSRKEKPDEYKWEFILLETLACPLSYFLSLYAVASVTIFQDIYY